MAEHAQIDIKKGKKVVRIHSGWGTPRQVLPTLRKVAATGLKTPLSIANEFIQQLPDASFGLSIIEKDFQRDALSYYYTVDISQTPWKVVQEKCAGHKFTEEARAKLRSTGMLQVTPDMVSPTITPARRRTLFIEQGAEKSSKKQVKATVVIGRERRPDGKWIVRNPDTGETVAVVDTWEESVTAYRAVCGQ